MYVCGPTVYDRAHIGNARPVVVFDVLYRLLRHQYGEGAVKYARNFTDVDDKINAKAVETKRDGETLVQAVRRITDETIGWYHEDMDALGALRPDYEPRATEYIGQMIAMGEELIARGHAYVAEGHVLFEARTDPEYGSLSRRPLDEMKAGARVEVAPYKRDPMDSVIWKPSTDDQPGWDSPWGRGRPGWHIECSAMAGDLLGEHFDIHGGGIDLQFPHHENECAQSRCVGHKFANIWMHNGYLMVEGEKMSKSLGNFFTVADLRAKGIPGEVMRFVLTFTDYRQPLDWTEDRLKQARGALSNWERLKHAGPNPKPDERVIAALSDDLNTSKALALIFAMTDEAKLANDDGAPKRLFQTLAWLGFDLASLNQDGIRNSLEFSKRAIGIAEKLDKARASKDFESADTLRAVLKNAGLIVNTSPEGTTLEIGPEYDPSKLPEVEDV
ncbi:UNVERIFIED_CONTAM: hypothetical protein GTU68_003090 [Idotea baltica]|nr:hypothetical protein [Idotea baltica]